MSVQVCVAVVIEKNGKILLVQEERDKVYEKSKGLWTLPAGKLEEDETLLQAALREVKEEVGYEIRLSGLIGVYQLSSNNNNDQVLGFAFRACLNGNKRADSFEHSNTCWVDSNRAIEGNRQFRGGMREIIEDHQMGKFLPACFVKRIHSC